MTNNLLLKIGYLGQRWRNPSLLWAVYPLRRWAIKRYDRRATCV